MFRKVAMVFISVYIQSFRVQSLCAVLVTVVGNFFLLLIVCNIPVL